MRTAISFLLTRTERDTLRRRAESSSKRLAQRARIVLLAADGHRNDEIAAMLGTDPQTVGRWRMRFASQRLAGIEKDAPRTGRKRSVREQFTAAILRRTKLQAKHRKRLGARALAKRLGVNHMLVYRIWREHGLTDSKSR